MSAQETEYRPDRQDRIGMRLTVGLIAAVAAVAVIDALRRLVELMGGGPVEISVPLAGESAELPLGPGGGMVEVAVDVATVQVSDPAGATLAALWALPVFQAVVVCVGAALLSRFVMRIARGSVLTGGASGLVYGGVALVIAGGIGTSVLTNIMTTGAMAALSDQTYDSVVFESDVTFAVTALVLGAVGVALQIGERMHKDTEGLV